MIENKTTAEDLTPLTEPVLQILISLSDNDLHGYAILGDVETRTGNEAGMSTSTLYGAVKRMMRDGLIEESDYRPDPRLDDQRRRYYRITGLGREVLRMEAARITRLAESVASLGLGA